MNIRFDCILNILMSKDEIKRSTNLNFRMEIYCIIVYIITDNVSLIKELALLVSVCTLVSVRRE